MALADHGTTFTKLFKLLLNIIVVVLYRNGNEGFFVGATHNKNHDLESFATGVYVGFLIYNCVTLLAIGINRDSMNATVSETLMNLIGFLLWLTLGGLVIQHWIEFRSINHSRKSGNPKADGIAMGVLSVVNSLVYLAETFLTYRGYAKNKVY